MTATKLVEPRCSRRGGCETGRGTPCCRSCRCLPPPREEPGGPTHAPMLQHSRDHRARPAEQGVQGAAEAEPRVCRGQGVLQGPQGTGAAGGAARVVCAAIDACSRRLAWLAGVPMPTLLWPCPALRLLWVLRGSCGGRGLYHALLLRARFAAADSCTAHRSPAAPPSRSRCSTA